MALNDRDAIMITCFRKISLNIANIVLKYFKLEDLKDDLFFFFSNEYWDLYIEFTDNKIGLLQMGALNLPRKSILIRLAIFWFGLFRSLFRYITCPQTQVDLDPSLPNFLILSGSDNEYKSTKFLENKINSNLIYCGIVKTKGCAPVRAYLIGALFMPLLLFRFLFCTAEQKSLHKYLSDQFLLVMGWRAIQRAIYRNQNITSVVYSNHMSPVSRSGVDLARKYSNALVVYIEHTPILKYWPIIQADIFFLSGQFSLDNMMKRSDIKGKDIYLLGSPKNDLLKISKKRKADGQIGLCVSTVDDIGVVKNLISEILSYDDSTKLIVRPHPSFRNFMAQLAIEHPRLFIRKPIDESVQEYLSSIDRLLVNDSGIFFECILAGVQLVRVKLTCVSLNNYGVPEQFSSVYDKSISEVISSVFSNDHPVVDQEQVKLFFGNVGTKFDNNASEIVSMVISSYVDFSSSVLEKRLINSFFEIKYDDNRIYNLGVC